MRKPGPSTVCTTLVILALASAATAVAQDQVEGIVRGPKLTPPTNLRPDFKLLPADYWPRFERPPSDDPRVAEATPDYCTARNLVRRMLRVYELRSSEEVRDLRLKMDAMFFSSIVDGYDSCRSAASYQLSYWQATRPLVQGKRDLRSINTALDGAMSFGSRYAACARAVSRYASKGTGESCE